MAFLASIKKRSDLRAKGVAREADDRDPTTVYDTPWIGELDPVRFTKLKSGGKWMMFYTSNNKGVPMWRKCQKLYRENKLAGVSNMKVSTSNDYHTSGMVIIILYCGPPEDESNCKNVGQTILRETGYTNPSKKMFYKTDKQTLKGGIGRHKYILPIPQENFENLKKKQIFDDNKQNVSDSINRPKPPQNLLAQINKKSKKKKKKKKPFTTRVRTKDGKVYKETINDNGTVTRQLEGQEVIPQYLSENDAKTKVLPSYIYNTDSKKWVEKKDDEKKMECEIKQLTILSYNIWFADKQWKERQIKLLEIMQQINPHIFCFQEVTGRFLSIFCENEYIRNNFELSDNNVANTVTPYGVFIGCNRKSKLSMNKLQISHLYSNMGRRLLSVEIGLGNESLWINTVHLESLLNKDVRINQLQSIFKEYAKDQLDSMLMGDFNFGDFTGENDYISEEFIDCWKTFVKNKIKAVDKGSNVEDDGLDPYRKMIQMGVPQPAIIHKMRKGGVSDDIIQGYENNNSLPEGGLYAILKKERGGTCGSQRYDRILLKSKMWKVDGFEIIGKPNMPSDHLGVVAKLKKV